MTFEEMIYSNKDIDLNVCQICGSHRISMELEVDRHNGETSKRYECSCCDTSYWVIFNNEKPNIITYLAYPNLGIRRSIYLGGI